MSQTFYNARNLIVSNGFVRNPERYYLEEFFKRKPAINADLEPSSADDGNDGATKAEIATMMAANKDFEILGTNASSDDVTFSSTRAGISLTTDGADNDQVILLPHLDSNQSAWTGIKWGTENEVEWECAISVANVANVAFWAGLKLTNTPVLATDANQAYFFFDTDDSVVGTLTVNTTLHFGYSLAGTDYTTNLGITVGADKIYRLRIVIDNYRQVSVFVNGLQYGLTTTSGTAGLTVSTSTQKGSQLTNDIDLIPYIGVQSTTAAADVLTVYYEKISRMLFE
jgi:hypothetical protein